MIAAVEALGFTDLKVSLKAFDVRTTLEANRRFAARSAVPLHLGLTEAGTPLAGAIRSAAALAPLLLEGIGDTLRISLAGDPAAEVRAARVLLCALGLRPGPVVVACPTCGRTSGDVIHLAERIEEDLESRGLDVVVAVMGCEVNGPGEARMADLGVAFGPRGTGLVFEGGQIVGQAANDRLGEELLRRLAGLRREVPDGE
jgi:(E)-4-hydroxy-3-methylbut-2-enyl-diphosphate synthase